MAPPSPACTKTHRSDDGSLVVICHYDEVTHELAVCDVYWFPLQATRNEVAQRDLGSPRGRPGRCGR